MLYDRYITIRCYFYDSIEKIFLYILVQKYTHIGLDVFDIFVRLVGSVPIYNETIDWCFPHRKFYPILDIVKVITKSVILNYCSQLRVP